MDTLTKEATILKPLAVSTAANPGLSPVQSGNPQKNPPCGGFTLEKPDNHFRERLS